MKIFHIASLSLAFTYHALSQIVVLDVSPSSVCPGQSYRVSWVTPSTANISQDWIGWYRAETPSEVHRWFNIGTAHSGSRTFTATSPGDFFLQYYRGTSGVTLCDAIPLTIRNDCYNVTVYPSNVVLCENFTVSWAAPSGVNTTADWIGWYRVETPTQVNRWFNIGTAQFGSRTFTAQNVGNYCVQYYRGTNALALTGCVPLTITADTNAQTITITNHTVAVGDQVHVQWHSIACLCDPNDTVGYFDANNPSIFVTTPIDGMCDGVICFVMNTPGTFMFGFFRGNSTNNITPLQVVTVGSPPVDSVLRLLIQRAGAGFVKISWFGQMGMRYDVLSSTNVSAPLASWPRITTISVTNSGVVNFTYPVTNTASLFFSVRKH